MPVIGRFVLNLISKSKSKSRYQKRLTSNVSFLGCLTDAVIPLQTSHLNNLGNITAANSADHHHHHLAHGYYPDVPASSSRQDIIDSLPAPISTYSNPLPSPPLHSLICHIPLHL